MENLNLPILAKYDGIDIDIFINFWQKFYAYKNEELYSNNINLLHFSKSNIEKLYEWKNGTPLSNLKRESLNKKVLSKIEAINDFKASQSIMLNEVYKEFDNVSAVWRLFLLHIIKPKEYPIYDQHIHRAFQFINDLPSDGITNGIKDIEKLEWYKGIYYPFVKRIEIQDIKKMDEAFFAFGKFLSRTEYRIMLN